MDTTKALLKAAFVGRAVLSGLLKMYTIWGNSIVNTLRLPQAPAGPPALFPATGMLRIRCRRRLPQTARPYLSPLASPMAQKTRSPSFLHPATQFQDPHPGHAKQQLCGPRLVQHSRLPPQPRSRALKRRATSRRSRGRRSQSFRTSWATSQKVTSLCLGRPAFRAVSRVPTKDITHSPAICALKRFMETEFYANGAATLALGYLALPADFDPVRAHDRDTAPAHDAPVQRDGRDRAAAGGRRPHGGRERRGRHAGRLCRVARGRGGGVRGEWDDVPPRCCKKG
jgi:hypothetical protein